MPSLPQRASYAFHPDARGAERLRPPDAAPVLGKRVAPEPALTTSISADLLSSKHLKQRRSFTSKAKKQKSSAKVKPNPADAMLIVGFDSEWVTEANLPNDDDGDGDGMPDERSGPEQVPHNRILSYQYACRHKGREWCGIVYTRAGARIRHPDKPRAEIENIPERIGFAALLVIAIADGIEKKQLTRWPKKIAAAAHWTRADLSAMAD